MTRYAIFASLGILLPAQQTLARWDHENAASLNQVIRLGSEYYNDILSYRDPFFWNAIWAANDLGFRSSAGSMNQKDFRFTQSIKLASSMEDPWQLVYASDRVEEPRRIVDQAALDLSYGPGKDGWRLGVLAEGQTAKAFADMGLRLSYGPSPESRWQIIVWAVDLFYKEKKRQNEDYRTRDPWTLDLALQQSWSRSKLRLRHEQDQPVIWYQISEDQRYAYRRQFSELLWTYASEASAELYVELTHEQESEAIDKLIREKRQGFEDRRSTIEFGQSFSEGTDVYAVSLWGLWNQTETRQADEDLVMDQSWSRYELALIGHWSRPFWKERHQQHWGLVLNQVELHEQGLNEATEVKIVWGPDFVLGEHARMRLTTTWDLDQIIHDFPFAETSFHPWGGGQASFIMSF